MKRKLLKQMLVGMVTMGVVLTAPLTGSKVQAEEVAVDATNFPDKYFREYILDEFDTDDDGALSDDEIQYATRIQVYSEEEWKSLKGIEYLTELEFLCFENSSIKTIDVSKNTKLKELYCTGNKLSSLDVSKNTKLESLVCSANKLTKLNVKKNTKLTRLSCDKNVKLTGARKKTTCNYCDVKAKIIYQITSSAKKTVTCSKLMYGATVVNIPDTVTIGGTVYKVTAVSDAFVEEGGWWSDFTEVTIGDNVETIGRYAFYSCEKLQKVVIGSGVKSIGQHAFIGCKKLKNITIKTSKLTEKNVGDESFLNIHSKATIKVPASKLNEYKKILKKKGVGNKVKFKIR